MPVHTIADRRKIYYLETNPAGYSIVLLLHGLGADCSSWALQIPDLTRAGFRILAPDARGFGRSSYPGPPHTIQKMAEDMLLLLGEFTAESAHVVGISMGGTLALQLALDQPQKVNKLILVDTFASLRPEKISVWAYFAFRLLLVHTLGLPAQARAVTQRIFPRPEQEELRRILYNQILQANPRAYRATMRSLALFNVKSRLGEIQAPTLVVTAENDTTVPPANQAVLARGIPNAQQVIIPGAGHAVTAEQPQLFNHALLKFLSAEKS